MDSLQTKYLIIGAGPTGLGAAYRLHERKVQDYLIVEKLDHVGGLAASVVDNKGFTWDLGGHVHFSHYGYYDDMLQKMMGDNAWLEHIRDSRIWLGHQFVMFPFQNNIYQLPPNLRWKCLAGLWKASRMTGEKPKNFKEWIMRSYGPGIADIFLYPYNFKVWAHPPEQMATEWMGDRIAPVKFWEILKNTLLKKPMTAWGPNNTFKFPRVGGTGVIWESVANEVGRHRIFLNAPVTKIDTEKKVLETARHRISYQKILNTMPIPTLAGLIPNLDDKAKDAAMRLKYSTTHLVGVGLSGQPPAFLGKVGWMYFPDPSIPFYRATVLSNHSPFCTPDPENTWSFLLEIAESSYLHKDITAVVEKSIEALLRIKFIPQEKDIISTWYQKEKYGYPTPHVGRDEILNIVQPALEQLDIFSRGRFGGWKYEVGNQDHTFMQGVEVVDHWLDGKPEITYPTPNIANAGVGKKR